MKLSLKKAIKGSTTFDLSSTHLTTMDFGSIQPTYFAEVVPNDNFHVSMSSFARLAPLAVPTFGRLECISRAFFVPMRSIWHGFEEWISRSNDQSLASSIPTISNAQLIQWISRSDYSFTVGSTDKYDFYSTFDDHYKRLNSRGRWLQKIFMSLGYSINYSDDDETVFSALPLLAFLRVFYDFIFPSQYVQSLSIGSLFQSRSNFTYTNLINAYKDTLYSPYAQDYFTSAWQSPNQVGLSDNVSIRLPADNSSVSSTSIPSRNQVDVDATSIKLQNGSNHPSTAASAKLEYITAYGLRVLKSVSDFITRNNIAGSRYFEQLLARFGVSSPKATPDRSVFLRSVSDPIQIQDVTATATTEGSVLGEQGAKGIQSSSGHDFSFSSESTYGYLIVLSHVMPNTGYYQGRKRHVLHKSVFDFYTPEFDSIGLQPIENQELYADYRYPDAFDQGRGHGGYPGNVFGFAPRYAEYKKRDDYLTGDFRVPSASTGLDSYHMMRTLPMPSPESPLALNPKFLLVRQHEFDRIFQQQGVNNTGFSFIETNHKPVFAYDGTPILFHDGSLFFVMSKANKRGDVSMNYDRINFIKFDNAGEASSYYNTTLLLSDNCPSLSNVTLTDGDYIMFDFADIHVTALYRTPAEWSIETTKDGVTGDGLSFFESSLLDYFDHFYSIFRYDVKASRTMLSISESMPIEDGGDSVSVDYEGFNFGM